MRDDDPGDALLARSVDDRERVVAGEVPRREDQVVARDRAQHLARLGQHLAAVARHHDRLDAQPEPAQLVLEARPQRHLLPRLRLAPPGGLRGRVDGRHPDDARALARRDLDRERVQAADGSVQRQRPDDFDPRDDGRDDPGPLRRRRVVRLEREAGQPDFGEAAREREVVDPPRDDVGVDVRVQIVGACDESPRPPGRLGRTVGMGRRRPVRHVAHSTAARARSGPLRTRP